jgi:DNA-binding SARP family transcriptional activator/Tfp pilus assembly protein PilF
VEGHIEFNLLGPLVVRRDGAVVPAAGRQGALLAALLLDANHLVTIGQLTGVLWGVRPPASARAALHNQVRRLRDSLGETGRDRICTQPGGYLIHVEPGELDVTRMQELLASARAAARGGAWERACAMAASAMLLWRGEPLAGIDSDVLARRIPDLTEIYQQAAEIRLEAEMNLGRHAEAIGELRRLTADQPFREHSYALLMIALYRCGRQGEAIAVYQAARRHLIGELGCEPGPDLRRVHQQILNNDPLLATPEPAAVAAPEGGSVPVVPRDLPGTIEHFAGRTEELQALTRILDRMGDDMAGVMVISAISGTAGVGKTALAVHWAHQIADRFPDGQLYINLRGYDPSRRPVLPTEAIRDLLDALSVPAERIPAGLDAQTGLYRSLLSARRMLLVLDNARDAEQVRPLLPGGGGCLVLITSRSQLAGLIATHDARALTLDLLTDAEARELLAKRLGSARLAAEPGAATELIGLCARLPLALAIAAARASAWPGLRLAALAEELQDSRRRLDALDTGDTAASTRAVFSWSVHSLPALAARMFGLLALHPGPDITIPAAASLAGISPPQARQMLGELLDSHLVTQHGPGRFAMHDLLRVYAAEQAAEREPHTERRAAIQRVLDYYLHTSHAAALLLNPHRVSVPALPPPRPGATPERLDGHQQALAWFEAEHQVLLGCASLAAETGSDACAWILPWAMTEFLDRRGHWHQWDATQRTALAAATRLGDLAGQAAARRAIATASVRLTDFRQARSHLAACLRLHRQLGDRGGEALARHSLGRVAEHQGRYADALRHEQQALCLFRDAADQAGQALALNAIGWYHLLLGRPQQARTFCRQALTRYRQTGYRVGQAQAWDSLGYAEHQLGRLDHATVCYQQALGILRDLGELYGQADTLARLGDTRAAAADLPAAQDAWQQALDILEDLRHPDAAQVRAKLRQHPDGFQNEAWADDPQG